MPDLDIREPRSLPLTIADAAHRPVEEVLAQLGAGVNGLSSTEAARRLESLGPNALRTHQASGWSVLARQLRSPILILLLVTAGLSLFLGDATNSIVIGVILLVSVGLGFSNEFRAERAAEALHSRVTHRAVVVRDATVQEVNVTALVPGDIVHLALGAIIPADIRLLSAKDLLCDESILTGESMPVAKDPAPVPGAAALGDLTSCLFMGTVIQAGNCTGAVVATGGRAEFGRIALGLGERQPQTEFQLGLQRFSYLLLQVAIGLTSLIFIANLLLQRPLIESLLFSLAIAVGITPQLLPAIVSTSLATGTQQLAKRKVLVKRLVCIEDLGDMDVLVTDKTGTLTEGRISFTAALPAGTGITAGELLTLGLLATEADYTEAQASPVGLNPLDAALWASAGGADFAPARYKRLDVIDFDHLRRRTSILVSEAGAAPRIVTKGSPEDVLALCGDIPASVQAMLDEQFNAGSRVVAVATRAAVGLTAIGPADEKDLVLAGFLIFLDRPKAAARASLDRLAELGITVKIATGDNAKVAEKVCDELGVPSGGTLTGAEVEAMSDPELASAAREASIFARVSPEQKARIIRLLRRSGGSVGFMGDGVNDALALHAADIGISVDSATDVAKDAADVVLLDKDLGVLAEGVMEGRRIFANTIKYVLMGTSSNFGNMFSAATASVVLSFLPMLPGQILLNNLLYDAGQLAIPGDRVDKDQLVAPSRWDIGFIRRFMFVFGPISSLFDFATFALMLFVFDAVPGEFRAGWFIESIVTQTLIIFVIRTRRVPFFRSRPSLGLVGASLGVVAVGVYLPLSPLAGVLGFDPLPVPFFLALLGMGAVYLVLVEMAKLWFYARAALQRPPTPVGVRRRGRTHRIARRAARFSIATAGPLLHNRGPGRRRGRIRAQRPSHPGRS
ncbi:magnesium-translocating P-type ATPase [Arthrobacter sp. AL08]|uniref:magnesium-translocating P-type ATPase n=1 Tax=unclassified Arthrobacter TaxID=235627 RepID=UPI00249B74B1|nr:MULTISPECIES: magnesium-translocating P-type ATPase [unclassified Arthrobacter]MDI3240181.1 magnesium-translocating P-type ATPase [Arthrobacter sp. AL05]MDI3276191.1 magnesium-translocating P-type ATPase [Arthrobacter sp. AL08]